jgi:hypothetical protein
MKEILKQLITISIEDQKVNLSLKQMLMLDGGPMEMVQEVKNGMHLKKSVDSQKTKKSFMKVQDNHGSQARTKKINSLLITYSTLDQDLNHLNKLILISLYTMSPHFRSSETQRPLKL